MDLISYILSRNNSERLAYTEGIDPITFDGNMEGKAYIPDLLLVKVSDNFVDLTKAVRLTQRLSNGEYGTTDELDIVTEGDAVFIEYNGQTAAASIPNGSPAHLDLGECGTFVFAGEDTWISKVEFTETIHPIDPKYIPWGYEKTVLYDGTPTKMDLTSVGMGYAYLLSSEDLFSLACGQNVHYQYTLTDGTTAHGVLYKYDYMPSLSVPTIYGAFVLLYASSLGGTGVSFNYADVGEFTNLKLWTEYSDYKPYYVTGYYTGEDYGFLSVDQDKAKAAAYETRLVVRYRDAGGNITHLTPVRLIDYVGWIELKLITPDSSSIKGITISNGQPKVES